MMLIVLVHGSQWFGSINDGVSTRVIRSIAIGWFSRDDGDLTTR